GRSFGPAPVVDGRAAKMGTAADTVATPGALAASAPSPADVPAAATPPLGATTAAAALHTTPTTTHSKEQRTSTLRGASREERAPGAGRGAAREEPAPGDGRGASREEPAPGDGRGASREEPALGDGGLHGGPDPSEICRGQLHLYATHGWILSGGADTVEAPG